MRILTILCACLTGLSSLAQKKSELQIVIYNLRYNMPNDGVNTWPDRKEEVKALTQYHDFDILGIQEGLHRQFCSIFVK